MPIANFVKYIGSQCDYVIVHFERNQWERRGAADCIRLKKTAIPTLFNENVFREPMIENEINVLLARKELNNHQRALHGDVQVDGEVENVEQPLLDQRHVEVSDVHIKFTEEGPVHREENEVQLEKEPVQQDLNIFNGSICYGSRSVAQVELVR
ncbi:hypothetical protein QAD02_020980 [Eretmocerus hayati]|uniref:Uncharacterized protein n=1 Tax=Eretmocerus hayati TaxID=131215 RepID=A0ACC2PP66_9HYME|nr:hypothetical protein QAD02_020980 [Eretmocerus hayati]